MITPNAILPIYSTFQNDSNVSQPQKFKPYHIIIPGRTQQVIKIPTIQNKGVGILNYIKTSNTEIPRSLVKIQNNFAITTILNLSEREIKLTITKPFNVELIDETEVHFFKESMPAENTEYSQDYDNLLKQNQKNLRLSHCNTEEYQAIRNLCFEYRDIFHHEDVPLSFTNQIKHDIKLKNDSPIFTKSYRYPHIHKAEVDSQVQKMLNSNIIQNSNSPWSSPIWIVPKKLDASNKKKWRVVIDYRKLNEQTIDDKFPLPNITDILDKLGKCNYFSTLDLANGFHQIEMNPNDIAKTAFSTDTGHYEFKRMPFGLKNAPSTFQRVMNNILRGLQNEICAVYLDDIIIFSTSLQEHIQRLRSVFQRIRESNFKIQLDKSEFLKREVAYLGHLITAEGVKPNPDKISAIKNYPIPKTPKEIKSFLGLAGYYRKFIRDFAKISKPMTSCLKKDAKVTHSPEFVNSFNHLKNLLINSPILQYPDFSKPFVLTTDASNVAIGSVLSQGNPPNDKPISYASRTLNETEQRYSVIERELLSIVWSCKVHRPYLFGNKFKIYTDHRPLVWLFNLKEPNSKLIRWRLKLEEYDFEIIYKNGKQNTNADALSRIQLNNNETDSIVNNPGDVNQDVLDYLRQLAENPTETINPQTPDETQNTESLVDQPINNQQKINIIQDIQINDTNDTVHTSSNETRNNGIPILDEIINNKLNQIIIDKNAHPGIKISEMKIDDKTIKTIKIPLNDPQSIIDTLKNYIDPDRRTYIYFQCKELIPLVTQTYMQHFKPLKLYQCTKLVNNITGKDEQLMFIKHQHEGKTNHRGIAETYDKLKTNYYWKNMKNDITNYINQCDICQTAKYSRQNPYVPLVLTETPNKPFQILHADLFYFDHQSFLTIIDKFTKLGQAYPCTKDAISVQEKLIQYFSTYGIPDSIVIDNGTEFKNETIQELLKLQKIKIHFTTPKHHESNSPIERFHSTLIEHLRILKQKHADLTPTMLMPYAIIAYNNTIHSSTKYTPFELTFGHTNLRDPFDLISTTFYSDYISNHKDKLTTLYHEISKNQELAKKKVISKHNEKGDNQYHFKINQTVYKKLSERLKSKNKFNGPYKLIELLEHNKAKIKNPKNNKTETIHLKELRKPHILSDSSSSNQE